MEDVEDPDCHYLGNLETLVKMEEDDDIMDLEYNQLAPDSTKMQLKQTICVTTRMPTQCCWTQTRSSFFWISINYSQDQSTIRPTQRTEGGGLDTETEQASRAEDMEEEEESEDEEMEPGSRNTGH